MRSKEKKRKKKRAQKERNSFEASRLSGSLCVSVCVCARVCLARQLGVRRAQDSFTWTRRVAANCLHCRRARNFIKWRL